MLDEIRGRLEGVPFEIAFNHGTHDRQYGLYPISSQRTCLRDFRVTSSRPDNTGLHLQGAPQRLASANERPHLRALSGARPCCEARGSFA